ncbi:MAG TPA: GNAT family protein [Mycobacteriales bacterium]|jgi:ribosomal-protein-alanine N-acetyltransferase|nr:GNAT family protein [Mycobacteriales bacterium]
MRALPGWPATLTEGDVVLRPHRRTDAKSWREVRLANQAWLEPWEATLAKPWERRHDPQDFVAMLRAQRKMMKLGHSMPFALLYRGRFAGQLTVGGIVRGAFYSAIIGYWVDRAVAGRGVMPTAVAMACDFCFYSAGLHRIEINIRPENTASRRVVEKLGFR